MKTKLLSLAIATFGFASLFADPTNEELQKQIDDLRVRLNMVEGPSDHHASAMMKQDKNGYGFIIHASGLYWKPKIDNTNLGIKVDRTLDTGAPANNFPRNDTLVQQDINWDWGFRVGVGYQFSRDDWRLGAEYTYFSANGTTSDGFGDDDGGFIIFNVLSPDLQAVIDSGSTVVAKRVRGDLKLDYDRVTLMLAKSYCISRYLDIEARYGLASSWVEIQQTGFYSGGSRPTFLGDSSVNFFTRDKFWGIGPTAGLGTHWNLAGGLSIYTDLTGDIMFGEHDIDGFQNVTELYQENTSDKIYRYLPMVTMQLGLAYDVFFNNYAQHLSISAGWEQQYWWDVYRTVDYLNLMDIGSLGLSGLTFKLLFEF